MTRFLPLVLMVIAALGAGAVLVPSAWEMASLKMRDKDFAAAERVFEDKFLAGERTRQIVLPLAELYVRNGRVDKAIGVLTKYAAANPGERDVAERLATLLKEAQEMPRAIAQLESLAKDHPDEAALRELDRQYDIAQNAQGRIDALMRLMQSGAASPKEIYTLTTLLAATNRSKDAMTVAYNAIKVRPDRVPHELVQTFAALALDNQRADLVASVVLPWAKTQKTVQPLNAVASALIDKGDTKSALALARSNAAFQAKTPGAIVLSARLEADYGDKAKAFELLDGLRRARALPPAQDEGFVVLALGQKKTDPALSHIWERGHQKFGDATLIYAVGQAAQERQTNWLKELDKALAVTDRKLPSARVALALGDAPRATAMAKAAEAAGPSVTLAQLYAELGDLASAARVFDASVPDGSAVSALELPQALAVAIALKRGPLALQLADQLTLQDKSPEASIQRTRALSLVGRAEEALQILAALKSSTDLAELAEIEALVSAKRFAALRVKLIARLADEGLSRERRSNFIFVLNDLKIALGPDAATLKDGLVAELEDDTIVGAARDARMALLAKIAPLAALPFIKSAAEADLDTQGYVYAKLLKDLKRKAELNAFLLNAARNAKSAKVRDDFLYELLKQGAGRDALPLLAERAQADGAKWFFAYDEALKKSGTRSERIAALQAFADLAGTPREMKSQIAFQILELGDKPRAETLFLALSENSGPASPEVRQLAFLWGPRPSPQAMAWLKKRAEAAPPSDRPAWAAILTNAGGHQIAEAVLAGSRDPQAIAALAGIFAETRNAGKLRSLIKSTLPGADVKTAKALGEAADALSLGAEASKAYESAGLTGPAGRAAFFAGEYERAVSLLNRAKGAPEASFYLAEALTALNRPRDAVVHYRAALERLRDTGDERKLRIVALARLKNHSAVERELAAAANDAGETSEMRDAYTGALLDQGDTDRAAAQLGL